MKGGRGRRERRKAEKEGGRGSVINERGRKKERRREKRQGEEGGGKESMIKVKTIERKQLIDRMRQ